MRFIKFFGTRDEQIERLRADGWRFATMSAAPVVAGWKIEANGKVSAKAWAFKADKPAWYYSFRNKAATLDYINNYTQGIKSSAEFRSKRDSDRRAARCNGIEAVYAKAAREGYITSTEAAVCLRTVLARNFPGVKFSVRSDNSISVKWTDGPSYKDVNAVACNYSGEGFDGMIDLRHSISRWLSRDGSMSLAHDSGTEGSMGMAPERIGSAHAADAILVRLGSDFVFCERTISQPVKREICRQVCRYYGIDMPGEFATDCDFERFINTTRYHGDYLCQLIYKVSSGALVVPPLVA